jgi:acetyltransferase
MPPVSMQRHYLNAVFEPRSVAIIGANSEADTAGGLILHNLRREPYTGALFPILAEGVTIHDLPCYGAIGEVEQAIDLAVITLPSEQVPAAVTQCADNHVRAIAVISAGFAEIGQRGERLQREVVEIARSHAIPLLGPDCLGVIRPRIGLHACYSRSRVNNGQVALVAQSSAFCSALLDWARASAMRGPLSVACASPRGSSR